MVIRFKIEPEGEASLGDGAYFCQGLGCVGVVLTSVFNSTLGDMSIWLGDPLAMLLQAAEVEGELSLFSFDILSSLAPLDENTDVRIFCLVLILMIGSGGLIRLLLSYKSTENA